VKLASLFLKGKSSVVIDDLVDKMESASKSLDFEQAARFRDQIATLRKVQQQQFVSGIAAEMDVVGLYRIKSQACVYILFIRDQKIIGSKSFFPTLPADTSETEVVEAFFNTKVFRG
jgi:excinuclease ABC subunit C